MSEQSARDALKSLVKSNEKKSDSARLFAVLDDVEAALSSGVSRRSVYEALLGAGFTFSWHGFTVGLHRARKKKLGYKPSTKPSPTQESQSLAPTSSSPAYAPVPSVVSSSPEPTKQEKYKQFQDSIKHLPERERRRLVADYITREAASKNPFGK